ncbi:MAG: hypothetical protein ACKVU1_12965, partial [bacterium]
STGTLTIAASCPPITNLECSYFAPTDDVILTWQNGTTYWSIDVYENFTALIATALPGDTTTFVVETPARGEPIYSVVGYCSPFLATETICDTTTPDVLFVRGDANGDLLVHISDGIYILNYMFQSGPANCVLAMDANDDGGVQISDPVYIFNYLFTSGPPPLSPAPPNCGPDPTPDALPCDEPPGCP